MTPQDQRNNPEKTPGTTQRPGERNPKQGNNPTGRPDENRQGRKDSTARYEDRDHDDRKK